MEIFIREALGQAGIMDLMYSDRCSQLAFFGRKEPGSPEASRINASQTNLLSVLEYDFKKVK